MTNDAILICEDDPVQARVLTAGAAKRGLTVYGPCPSAEEAIAAAKTAPIRGALLDVSLEGGTVARIAQALEDRGLPFAFITGYGPDTTHVLRAFNDHLAIPKPISMETLDMILDSVLDGVPLEAVG
ncbi:MAG: hypothetical protein HRU11_13615 [Parvularculaceae bacterium]|nr:hypothetical protein [Parvularculaceae bacterium]